MQRLLRALSFALLLPVMAAHADRLHLEGGGVIDVDGWWVEDDVLHYETAGGTMGVPRSLVVRIEKTEGGVARADRATSPPPESEQRGGRGAAPSRETVRLMRSALEALQARDFEAASEGYLAVFTEEPELMSARVGYTVSEMALGHDGLALSVVLDGLARQPGHPELLELLGDLRNREERVVDALQAWQDSFRVSATDRVRDKILKAERELAAGRDYDFATTAHFNLRYDGEVDRALAGQVMEFLEEQYWELAAQFDHAPRQPITVQLFPERQFRAVTHAPEWVGGLYDGKIRVPLAGLRRLDPAASRILVHELTHAVVHSKSRGQCPRWLHEGLAQVVEGRQVGRADRQEIAEHLVSGDPATWEERGFTYPLALSLTRWLEERGGFHRLVTLVERLGDGRPIETAMNELYGDSYSALCRRWARDTVAVERR